MSKNNKRVRKDIKYKILKDQVGECFSCGRKARLSMHHIERQRDAPDRRNDPSNIVAVCSRCHLFLHQGEHRRAQEYKPQKTTKFKDKQKSEEIEVLFFSDQELRKTKFGRKVRGKIIY